MPKLAYLSAEGERFVGKSSGRKLPVFRFPRFSQIVHDGAAHYELLLKRNIFGHYFAEKRDTPGVELDSPPRHSPQDQKGKTLELRI